MEMCLKMVCDSKYFCLKKCYEDCGKCLKLVMKKYSNCGYENEIFCWMDFVFVLCKVECIKKL